MIALVDCQSFYCSCERVFRPDLKEKPIIVLSNNDHWIIALNAEAKKLESAGLRTAADFIRIPEWVVKKEMTTVGWCFKEN